MARIGARNPVWFTDRSNRQASGVRADKLSKSDWMDVFCDLYRQTHGEQSTPEQMLADAERRLMILKANGVR